MSRKLPGSVLTGAILLFVYGAYMLICGIASGGINLAVGADDPVNQALAKELPAHYVVEAGVVIFNVILGLAMIASGALVLLLHPAGRWIGSGFAAADMILSLVMCVYSLVVIQPIAERELAAEMGPAPFDLAKLTSVFIASSACFGVMMSWCLCAPILITLNMKSARDAFAGKLPPPPDTFEPRDRDDQDDDDNDPQPRPPSESRGDTGIIRQRD